MQDGKTEPYWHAVSYPYASVLKFALKGKKASSGSIEFPFTIFLIKKIIQKQEQSQRKFSPEDYSQASDAIAEIYRNNVRDIEAIAKARGVQALFVLQPVIYVTDNLSPSETKIAEAQNQVDMQKLYRLSYQKLRSTGQVPRSAFLDMSQALSDKSPLETYYTDMCHLNAAGQKFMSRKIVKNLLKMYPEYFPATIE
jgi:lysophospholipase L1-like esterase